VDAGAGAEGRAVGAGGVAGVPVLLAKALSCVACLVEVSASILSDSSIKFLPNISAHSALHKSFILSICPSVSGAKATAIFLESPALAASSTGLLCSRVVGSDLIFSDILFWLRFSRVA
jgi:hypothetical protein